MGRETQLAIHAVLKISDTMSMSSPGRILLLAANFYGGATLRNRRAAVRTRLLRRFDPCGYLQAILLAALWPGVRCRGVRPSDCRDEDQSDQGLHALHALVPDACEPGGHQRLAVGLALADEHTKPKRRRCQRKAANRFPLLSEDWAVRFHRPGCD